MKFLYTLLILLTLVTGILCYTLFMERRTMTSVEKDYHQQLQVMGQAWKDALLYSGKLQCDTSLSLADSLNIKTSLGQYLARHSPVLILRISQNYCIKCLDTELPRLQQYAKQHHVMIVTNRANFTEISRFLALKHLSLPIFSISDNKTIFQNIDEHNIFFFPILFSTDNCGVGKSFFILNPSAPALSEVYYNFMGNEN